MLDRSLEDTLPYVSCLPRYRRFGAGEGKSLLPASRSRGMSFWHRLFEPATAKNSNKSKKFPTSADAVPILRATELYRQPICQLDTGLHVRR